jgi:DNA-binding ferritin-like protein (Dps family)
MRTRLEILFPHSRVSGLKNLHDEEWKSLVERIAALPETHPDALAFSYMMIKLCNCLNCDLGSYKASLGCSVCSQRTISAVRDNNKVLMKEFKKAKKEVLAYLNSIGADEEMAA